LVVLAVGLLAMAGCATKGTVNLDVQAVQPSSEAKGKKTDGLTVTVASFQDSRPDKNRLGVRRHFWGGETTFNVPGGKPSDVVAKVMTDYLKRKGWRVDGSPDVTLSGKLLNFSVNAESRFAQTEITVRTKLVVEGTNKADGSIVRMTLNGDGTQKVFWFDPEDAQELASEVLSDSLEKLLMNTKVENNLLRLK
jgi:phosphoribosylformylglycinamidine (FGAM) synthase PurS component